MTATDHWIDLLDPSSDEIGRHLPESAHARVLERIGASSTHDDEPRPALEAHGDYIFGVFLVPVVVAEEDLVYYQELDLVVTSDRLITVRKTPSDGKQPFDAAAARASCRDGDPIGMAVYHLVDDVAERFLDIVDSLNDEIEELEDGVEAWDADRIRKGISRLRHDLLRIRRTLAPTRDAIRQIVDNRIELEGAELFSRDVELSFGGSYDKLLRASDGLELSRDLVAGVRDYHQAKVSNDQNDVMKRLTVIAALLLLPTFIVGLYGQNFVRMPELHWVWGYWWSWGLILGTTVLQLAFFKWKKWL